MRNLLSNQTTISEWLIKREKIKDSFFNIIGKPYYKRNTRDFKILSEEQLKHYIRIQVCYKVGHNELINAFLLKPNIGNKLPAVLAMHQFQNSDIGKKEPAGLAGDKDLHIAHELAIRGYVVLVPDYLTAGERVYNNEPFSTQEFYIKYPLFR